jgi:hypothetical protein
VRACDFLHSFSRGQYKLTLFGLWFVGLLVYSRCTVVAA